MEQEVLAMLNYSDKAVHLMLHLQEEDRERQIAEMLDKAKKIDETREVLIMDLLYETMSENLDDFPNNLRISPAERNRGEAFL